MGVVLELADVGPLGELIRSQGQQNVPVADEVASELLGGRVVLDQVLALGDRHHELRAKQAVLAYGGLHAGDELGERTVVVGL